MSSKSAKPHAPAILPNPQWLKDHGYREMVEAMQANPEAFAHIRQQTDKPTK